MLFEKIKFYIGFSLVFLLILLNHNFSISAEVESKKIQTTTNLGYVPPATEKNVQQVTVNASRGTCQQPKLRLISPINHIPQTTSAHPIFLIYLPNGIRAPLIFTIVEPKVTEPIVEKQLNIDKSGFVEIKTPPTAPELEPEKEYILTLMVVCNEQRPSENSYVRIIFKRVLLPEWLEVELEKAPDDLTRSEIYATSGIWFDSVATIYEAYAKNPQESKNAEFFGKLLRQVDFVAS